jgi:hypothetical protein
MICGCTPQVRENIGLRTLSIPERIAAVPLLISKSAVLGSNDVYQNAQSHGLHHASPNAF